MARVTVVVSFFHINFVCVRETFGLGRPQRCVRYERFASIGPVEAVVDGWLYDHELTALRYGLCSLATLFVGGQALAWSLTRPPQAMDPAAAALDGTPIGVSPPSRTAPPPRTHRQHCGVFPCDGLL